MSPQTSPNADCPKKKHFSSSIPEAFNELLITVIRSGNVGQMGRTRIPTQRLH